MRFSTSQGMVSFCSLQVSKRIHIEQSTWNLARQVVETQIPERGEIKKHKAEAKIVNYSSS